MSLLLQWVLVGQLFHLVGWCHVVHTAHTTPPSFLSMQYQSCPVASVTHPKPGKEVLTPAAPCNLSALSPSLPPSLPSFTLVQDHFPLLLQSMAAAGLTSVCVLLTAYLLWGKR